MIRHMQKGALAWFFMAILILTAFSLILTDWTGSFRAGVGGGDIARMTGDKITAPEFTNLVSRIARAENLNPSDAYANGLVSQILTSEIWQRLMALNTKDLGIQINDATLLDRLKEMATPIAAQEKTDISVVLKRYIQNQGLTEAEFLETMRRDLGNNLMRQVISSGSAPSPFIVQDLLAYNGQTRDIQYVVFKDDAVDVPAPTDDQLKAYHKERQNNFMVPERRDLVIGFLSRAPIMDQIKIDETDIKSYADANPDILQKPEQRTIDFVVFKTESDAQSAVTVAKGTSNFKQALSKKFPAAKVDQGTFDKTENLADYLKPVFTASMGDIIGPVQTPLGFYVMSLASVAPGGVQPVDTVRSDIEKILKDERLNDRMDKILDDLTTASDRGDAFDTVAQSVSLTPVAINAVARDGMTPTGSDAFKDYVSVKGQVLTAAFADGTPDRLLPPLELPNGDIAVIQIKSIKPAHPKDLSEIKGALILDYLADKRRDKNIMDAQTQLPNWIAGKTDLEKIATAKGKTVLTLSRVPRDQKELPPGVDRAAWSRLFTATPDVPVFEPVPGGVMMAVVKSITLADPSKISDTDRKNVINAQTQAQGQEQLVGYMGMLSDRYNPRVNDRLIKRIFDRPEEQPN